MMPVFDRLMFVAADSGYGFWVPDVVFNPVGAYNEAFIQQWEDQGLRAVPVSLIRQDGASDNLIDLDAITALIRPYHCLGEDDTLFSDPTLELIDSVTVTWLRLAGRDELIDEGTFGDPLTLDPDQAAAIMARFHSCDLP
jgi:hypothetical protein